ncbi:AtpZ/AtpI family protein [Nocardioides plantarum]|uniref:AtpZ/AtpI family protein n=1 Tax=Nocardioides plantarum TaxID=29299 RepID=A0ABV5K6U8_9ACTN|nr:AtpZ/AtpI family protein [Nocardioides plantarum]
MSKPDDELTQDSPRGDPWLAFGYLVAGVLLYGGVGWLLDRWWGTSFMIVIGILLGVALALYQTFARFRAPTESR